MNLRNFIFLVFILALCSCNKDKPKVGKYWVTFKYENPSITDKSTNIEIVNVDKGSLEISGSVLKKDKKNISGTFKQLMNRSAGGSKAEVTSVFEMKRL